MSRRRDKGQSKGKPRLNIASAIVPVRHVSANGKEEPVADKAVQCAMGSDRREGRVRRGGCFNPPPLSSPRDRDPAPLIFTTSGSPLQNTFTEQAAISFSGLTQPLLNDAHFRESLVDGRIFRRWKKSGPKEDREYSLGWPWFSMVLFLVLRSFTLNPFDNVHYFATTADLPSGFWCCSFSEIDAKPQPAARDMRSFSLPRVLHFGNFKRSGLTTEFHRIPTLRIIKILTMFFKFKFSSVCSKIVKYFV